MHFRSRFIALCLGLLVAVATSGAFAQGKASPEAQARTLQKKAMEDDYLSTEFAKAQEKLDKAIATCGTANCPPQLRALLRRDLGVVLIAGQIDRDRGIAAFADALKTDPTVQLDPDLKTKELQEAWDIAKKTGGGGAVGPSGDFSHTPVAEQQVRTPIPVYVEYTGTEELVKVTARYRGFGMSEWKALELRKLGKGFGGLIPCQDVQQGTTLYYVQGLNKENDMVASSGDRNTPYKVVVKREKIAGDPPHLPDMPPPSQCADTGDCPPDFPGCKKGPGTGDEGGKADGGECDDNSECKSGICKNRVCTAKEEAPKFKRVWVGIWGGFDVAFVPSGKDVCKLSPAATPLNDPPGYYCTTSDGSDYPSRKDPTQNDDIALGNVNAIDNSGSAAANARLGLSVDYAVNENILVGGRLGFFFLNTYPGSAAKDEGKALPIPIHVEARGTYLFGHDAILQKFAPFAFLAAGVTNWHSSVAVKVKENSKPGTTSVDAWNIAGPGFVGAGGGVRFLLSPNVALNGALRLNLAIGNGVVPVIGPEITAAYGF